MSLLGSLTQLKDLNGTDRDNLADIAWYIKGMIHMGDETFHDDHIKTLERVIQAIRNKINDEKNVKERTCS